MTSHSYEYPRPAVSADCVILGWETDSLKILLIKRGSPPFQSQWALPGGFLDENEDLNQTPLRELKEETGLCNVSLRQLHTFGERGRDPRTRVITVAYLGLVHIADHPIQADDDADDAQWFSIQQLPELAFDHRAIIGVAIHDLQFRVRCRPFGLELLPPEFTIAQLLGIYESILDKHVEHQDFESRILKTGLLVKTGNAESFRFDRDRYNELDKDGVWIVL